MVAREQRRELRRVGGNRGERERKGGEGRDRGEGRRGRGWVGDRGNRGGDRGRGREKIHSLARY